MSWRDWFKIMELPKPEIEVVYKIIEIKAPRTRIQWDKSTRDAIIALQSHPGLIALIDRLALQRAQLEAQLSHSFHKDLREVDILQAGIYWCNWLQDTIARTTRIGSTNEIDPLADELAAFKEIDSAIERVCEVPKV